MTLLALNREICHWSITRLRLPMALLARLIADWPQGCKWGPLISAPLLPVDPLPFLKSAWPFLGSLTACSVDSDGWADAMGCCITPPPTPSTTTTPSAPAIRCRASRLHSSQAGSSLKALCVQKQKVAIWHIHEIFTNSTFSSLVSDSPGIVALLYIAFNLDIKF